MIEVLSDDEIEEVLRDNIIGRIGCNDGQKNYVVPMNYVYDRKFIVGHSLDGMKVRMMRKNSAVCFEVDEIKNNSNWRSVIAWGVYQELIEERDRYYAMKLFLDRMLPIKVSKAMVDKQQTTSFATHATNGNLKPIIYRIVIEEITGRFERDIFT